ncbi:hypothetical protein [Actinoplanes sp. RD1]|uniref:hypothetical protein n=1 Tax=Actinoplanes sp. RD1 TaxID=3064538 RepID=UPI0027409961|nr:hypothetical protein [Actinoplanes sp. RD1]
MSEDADRFRRIDRSSTYQFSKYLAEVLERHCQGSRHLSRSTIVTQDDDSPTLGDQSLGDRKYGSFATMCGTMSLGATGHVPELRDDLIKKWYVVLNEVYGLNFRRSDETCARVGSRGPK